MTKLKKFLAADEHGPANWVWILGLLLGGAGAQLWLIHRFGTPLPFWDQWEHTRTTFVPYFEGRLSWAALLSPHNEHRIFFTRLYDLALLLLDGQWDNQVQMVANTFVYTAGLAGCGWLLARALGRQYWPVIATTLLLALTLPFTWENTLAGFQSQVYFVILTTLATVWLMGFHGLRSVQWWFGVVVAFVSLFTMGSGLIGSATVIGLVVLRELRTRGVWKQQWPAVVVGVVAVALGLALKVEVPYHQILKAHSISDFLISLGKYLAWPWIVLPPFALFNILPLLLLAWVYLRNRTLPMRREEIVLALGIWSGLQAAACAYTRGHGGAHPQWRYMDATCFIMIANALALALLITQHRERVPFRRFLKPGAALWALACAGGLGGLSHRAWTVDIPQRVTHHRFQLETAHAYIATGDAKYLDVDEKEKLSRFAAPNEPQDHAKAMMDMLAPAKVREILPACVRAPLPMVRASGNFLTNGIATPTNCPPGEICWSSGGGVPGVDRSFSSQPIGKPKLPFLEFQVTGNLGQPDTSLSVVELSNGKRTEIKPRQAPLGTWLTCRIPSPRGDFRIEAIDKNAGGWFAFQPPRELGRISLWADRLAAAGAVIFWPGFALYLAAMVSSVALWRRSATASRPGAVGKK